MRQLCFAIATASILAACGEVVPLTPDAPIDAQEIDAMPDPCAKSELNVDEFFACVSRAVCAVYEDCIGSDASHLDCEQLPFNFVGGLPNASIKTVIADAVASNRARWNGAGAKACVDALTASQCALFKNNADPFDTCAAITGLIPNGGACQNQIECAVPGSRCQDPAGGGDMCTGHTCVAPVATGQMCTAGAFCAPTDHCVYRLAGGTTDISFCSAGNPGEVCDGDDDCNAGLFCNGGLRDGTAMGVCAMAKPAGSSCRTDEECQGELACVGNFGAVNGTCRDVRVADAVCDANDFASSCYGHQNCETPATNTTGVCRPAADLGQACNVMNGTASFCGLFMSCEGGVCRAPGELNEVCTASNLFGGFSTNPNGCNMGLFCDRELTGQPSGVCRAPQPNGGQCSAGRHCASGYCSNNVCADYPTCFP